MSVLKSTEDYSIFSVGERGVGILRPKERPIPGKRGRTLARLGRLGRMGRLQNVNGTGRLVHGRGPTIVGP